jgi:hypothetical protein
MKYYILPTEAEAQAAIVTMDATMMDIAAAHGLTVIPGVGVVGKNAATGVDDPTAPITATWAVPQEVVGGGWGIPSCRIRFPTSYPQVEAAAGLSDPVDAELIPLDEESE